MCTLMIMGRSDLIVFAVFGAFTGVYGRGMDFSGRLMTQTRAAGLMVTVILAAMLGHLWMGRWGVWELVFATTVVAGVCSAVARLGVFRPSGSLFHIFAFASISSIPVHPPLWQGMTAAIGSAALSVIIGAAYHYRPGDRPQWVLPRDHFTWPKIQDALKEGALTALVAGLAGVLATWLSMGSGLGHQYWAMVAAVVPLQALRARHVVFRGMQRITGTLLGLIPLAIVLWINPGPWGTVVAVGICQFIVELVVVRQYLIAQMFVTPLALLSISLSGHLSPATMLKDRVAETIIGSVVGMAVLLVVRYPDRIRARVSRRAAVSGRA
jgi:hypothetical protein